MKLYIDTTDGEEIVIGIDGNKYKTETKKEKSQKLLPFIDEKLKENDLSIEDISEIEVEIGPGSFTGIRVGVSVANTIGWAMDIPVNGNITKDGKSVEIKYE